MAVEDLTWFQHLSTPEVAALVRERGPRTVVFAMGGTKRWFMLNYLDGWPTDTSSYWQGYLTHGGERLLSIMQMFFDHGVHTLFTHAIVPGQLEGQDKGYPPLALTTGMELIAGTPEFVRFYKERRVRVRFFGDYRQVLKDSPYAGSLALFDELAERTKANDHHFLYWGFNAQEDPMTPILELATQYYREHGRAPSREEVIELYYGEPVGPVDIFIGFNRPKTANLMPPLLENQADLYFTVGPSLDLSLPQFRNILYDHIFARQGRHRDYGQLSAHGFSELQAFYRLNQGRVTGVGRRYEPGGVWHPLPQVQLPPGWDEEDR